MINIGVLNIKKLLRLLIILLLLLLLEIFFFWLLCIYFALRCSFYQKKWAWILLLIRLRFHCLVGFFLNQTFFFRFSLKNLLLTYLLLLMWSYILFLRKRIVLRAIITLIFLVILLLILSRFIHSKNFWLQLPTLAFISFRNIFFFRTTLLRFLLSFY